MSRPHVPAALERRLKEEAGYRCAIPTCRNMVGIEMAHIVPRSIVKEDKFENMILLCATCHVAYDREKRIPRKSMEFFKANLAVVNGRYSDFEHRVMEHFADLENREGEILTIPFHHEIHLRNLLRDGLLTLVGRERHIMSGSYEDGLEFYSLTPAGRVFIHRWIEGEAVDDNLPGDPSLGSASDS